MCWMCQCTYARALKLEAEVDREMEALGLFTNEKRQSPAQQGEFIGLDYDTAACVFVLTKEKAEKLEAAAVKLLRAVQHSPRELAKYRGKLVWYSPCVQGVNILTRQLNKAIGAHDSDEEWDRKRVTEQGARAELQWLAENLGSMAERARPMWELNGEQAVRAFKDGHTAIDAMLITDASVHGWGAILYLRTGMETREFRVTGRWPFVNDLEQAHREAQATPTAFRAMRHLLHGRSLVHISDCAVWRKATPLPPSVIGHSYLKSDIKSHRQHIKRHSQYIMIKRRSQQHEQTTTSNAHRKSSNQLGSA